MSTGIDDRPASDQASDAAGRDLETDHHRVIRWSAGWRVALRLARRDVHRHRGRSILVVVLIGLPVALLTFAAVLAMSSTLDDAEQIPYLFGPGQAVVSGPVGSQAFEQTADGSGWGTSDTAPAAAAIPGLASDPTAAIGRLVGGTVVPFAGDTLITRLDGQRVEVPVLRIDLADRADLGQRAHLLSGRWPSEAGEVVVTRYGVALGLPSSGRLVVPRGADPTAGPEASESTAVVVGTADAVVGGNLGPSIGPAALVLPFTGEPTTWLVIDREPVDWATVQELNRHALLVQSRAVLELPADERPAADLSSPSSREDAFAQVVAASSALLLLTTSLFAGPAFAVGAIRQRRSLALAAANGATPGQLRTTVLGQAVVLGGLSALAGLALGLGAVAALAAAELPALRRTLWFGLDVPWLLLLLVAVAALLSAVVAALVPARSLGRLEVVRVMRGQEVAAPPRRRLALAGLALVALGMTLVLWQRQIFDGSTGISVGLVGGCLALVVGALCLTPMLLELSARWARPLPLAWRMAVRDSARQRARTAPTVAAVMASGMLLSTTCIALASDTAFRTITYQPLQATGLGRVSAEPPVTPEQLEQVVRDVDGDVAILHPRLVLDPASRTPTRSWRAGVVLRPGCDATTALVNPYVSGPDASCLAMTSDNAPGAAIRVLPAAELAELLGLDAAQRSFVDAGAIVVADPATRSVVPRPGTLDRVAFVTPLVEDGRLTLTSRRGTIAVDTGEFTPTQSVRTDRVPVLTVPWTTFEQAQTQLGVLGLVTSTTATKLGWPTTPDGLLLRPMSSAISEQTESQLKDALEVRFDTAAVHVERGFQRDDLVVVLVLVGVVALLMLVATFVSTALSLAEQQPLMGTLAAVGATRGTRRLMAGGQALHLSALGAVTGVALGVVPGIAIARATTVREVYDGTSEVAYGPFVVVPWLQLLAPVVLVPLLAAGFAWLAVRRSPAVTRRMT